MMKIERILAPTDLSQLSQAGLRYALELGQSQGAELIIYNVIEYGETSIPLELTEWVSHHSGITRIRDAAQERRKLLITFVGENFADILPQVRVRYEADMGVPYKRIVEKAAEESVQMIVMSTHGRTGLLHAFVGSVTEKVVRLASCPVLSVRPVREPKVSRVAVA